MDTLCYGFTSFLLMFLLIFHSLSAATDTIYGSESIIDGETLVSSGGKFELGFFSPGNSTNRYVGLWPRNLAVQTVFWVANREVPITNTTGVVLTVAEPGILVLMNDTNGVLWSSNTSRSVRNPVAQLLDSGNLVVRDANDNEPENYLWQSFDHPTDTSLAGLHIGWNLRTGLETYILSWRNSDDPSPGDVSFSLDLTGFPQVVMRRGNDLLYRIGPWNGIRFSGGPNSQEDPTYRLVFVMNENEVYYREDLTDRPLVARVTVNQSGVAQRLTWIDGRGWVASINMPADICDTYGLCGGYGICNVDNSPSCTCLDRFVPRVPDRWFRTDWSNGCVRRTNLSCEGDTFLRYSGIKLPDVRSSWHNASMTIGECRAVCLRTCSCTAYTQLDISRRSGCLIWYDELIDIRSLSSYGQDIYIRMASSESVESERRNRRLLIATLTSLIGVVFTCLSIFLWVWKRKNDLKKEERGFQVISHDKDSELSLFNLSVILKATNNFSVDNKLGEGGFGPVYKGILEGGQEIAVKRLSNQSTQGLDEFKNEVILIAKLQHRNLVRILGCCIQGEENMLIYEYMPNKSLDVLLFDQPKNEQLDWAKRFYIINGVARGLLYLHQDSRLRIIHRDLKASNILLDFDMNPKISDFGIARSFGGNEIQAKTRRIIGTYGYMSPEYAVDGLFSVKSDVFSFGVLVLEIVTGNRNRGFYHSDHSYNLLGHAWTLYKEGRSMELVDASLGGSYLNSEALRSIHVGLLCVQKNPEDRPSMSSVVLMLGDDGVFLPQAKQPGFFTEREVFDTQSPTNEGSSTNEVTITMLEGR